MITVLVSSAGGDIAQGVLKSLNISRHKKRINTIGTDTNAQAAGLYMCGRGYIVEKSRQNPARYLRQIISICKNEKINLAFICNEDEQLLLASKRNLLAKKIKTYFVVQPLKTISICRDKLELGEFLRAKRIRYPDTCAAEDSNAVRKLVKKHGWPVAVKLQSGYGGFGSSFKIIHNAKELKRYLENNSNMIVQEYIANKDEEEYTVGLFLDGNSKVLGSIAMLRTLRFSLTWHAIVDDYPDITAVAVKAAESVGAVGPCNVQLRRDKNNRPCVIEINSRISSSTAFRALLGFNDAAASIDYFLYNKKPNLKYKPAVAMKIWDELIVSRRDYEKLKKRGKIQIC